MTELTAEQLEKAQTMTLEELRAAAIAEAAGLEVVETPPIEKSRDEKGRFTPKTEDEPPEDTDDEPKEDDEPAQTIYRKEIDLGDGSGVQVFEGDTLEELVDKLADAQKHATKKIRELNAKVKTETVRTAQEIADDEYVIAERLKKEPRKTMKEVVSEVIEEREAKVREGFAAQERFVATHPDFIPNPENAGRLTAWLQSHGHKEMTYDGLEKAYQDLKASGLLKLKAEGSEEATDTKGKETQRIVEPEQEVTQPRSQKKGSTIPTRSRTPVTPANAQPSEDEAYAMPLEKLRELANKQLAERQAE